MILDDKKEKATPKNATPPTDQPPGKKTPVSQAMQEIRKKREAFATQNQFDPTKDTMRIRVIGVETKEEEDKRGKLQLKIATKYIQLNSNLKREQTKVSYSWTEEAELIISTIDIDKIFDIRQGQNDRGYVNWIDIKPIDSEDDPLTSWS